MLSLRLLLLALAAVLVPQEALRSVEIWSEHPIAVDIEWVTIDESDEQTITATRMTAVGPLEAKGLVTSTRTEGADTASRRVFAVTPSGSRALAHTRELRKRLWVGVKLRPERGR